MEKIQVPPPSKRKSYLDHRRQVIRQIILPVALFAILMVAVAVLAGVATFSGPSEVATWAAISTIWLVMPLMILMLVILALTAGLAYGLTELLKITPRYTGLVQVYAQWINAKIVGWADQIVEPVLKIKTWIEIFSKREEK